MTDTFAFMDQFTHDGVEIDYGLVAQFFSLTNEQLMSVLGPHSSTMPADDDGHDVQARLNQMLRIIGAVIEWAGGPTLAMKWYRTQPIPSLGGLTPQQLVNRNQASLVEQHLEVIRFGGYA